MWPFKKCPVMLYTSEFGHKMAYAKPNDIGMDIPVVIERKVVDGTRRFEINNIRDHDILVARNFLIGKSAIVPPNSWATFPSGLCVKIPDDSWMFIASRSSTCFNKGLISFYGILDSGYVGEILARVYNPTHDDIRVDNGDKLCQAIIVPRYNGYHGLKIQLADKLPLTDRGTTGFGSSGK